MVRVIFFVPLAFATLLFWGVVVWSVDCWLLATETATVAVACLSLLDGVVLLELVLSVVAAVLFVLLVVV